MNNINSNSSISRSGKVDKAKKRFPLAIFQARNAGGKLRYGAGEKLGKVLLSHTRTNTKGEKSKLSTQPSPATVQKQPKISTNYPQVIHTPF